MAHTISVIFGINYPKFVLKFIPFRYQAEGYVYSAAQRCCSINWNTFHVIFYQSGEWTQTATFGVLVVVKIVVQTDRYQRFGESSCHFLQEKKSTVIAQTRRRCEEGQARRPVQASTGIKLTVPNL
jgi:hypothetical protein